MSIWHYNILLVPDIWMKETFHKGLPDIPTAMLRQQPWWQTHSLSRDYAARLAKFLPPTKSWSADLELFGNEEEHYFEIFREGGKIVSVTLRYDLRRWENTMINKIASFVAKQKCYLADARKGTTIPAVNIMLKFLLIQELRARRARIGPDFDGLCIAGELYFREKANTPQ